MDYYKLDSINIKPIGNDHIYDSLKMYTEILEKEIDYHNENSSSFIQNNKLLELKSSLEQYSRWIISAVTLINDLQSSIAQQNLFFYAAKESTGINEKATYLFNKNDVHSNEIKSLLTWTPKTIQKFIIEYKDEQEVRRLKANKVVNEKIIAKLSYTIEQLEQMLKGNQKVTQLSTLLKENIQLKEKIDLLEELINSKTTEEEKYKENKSLIKDFLTVKPKEEKLSEIQRKEIEEKIKSQTIQEIIKLSQEFHKKGNINSMKNQNGPENLIEIFESYIVSPYSSAKEKIMSLENELQGIIKSHTEENSFHQHNESSREWLNEKMDTLEKEVYLYKNESCELKRKLDIILDSELNKIYKAALGEIGRAHV